MALWVIDGVVNVAYLFLIRHRLLEIPDLDRHGHGALQQIFLQLPRVQLLNRLIELSRSLGLLRPAVCSTLVMSSCLLITLLHLLKQEEDRFQTVLQITLLLVVQRRPIQRGQLPLNV